MIKRFFPPTARALFSGAAVAALVILAGVSCRGERRGTSADSAFATSSHRPPVAGRYSVQDFGRLRWLDGSWRGRLPNGGFFYESYRLLDDSTILMSAFHDPEFSHASDSTLIVIRGGTVIDQSNPRWLATRLDASGVDFASERDASNNFTWTTESPKSPDRWTATLRSMGQDGRPRITVYPMERVRR